MAEMRRATGLLDACLDFPSFRETDPKIDAMSVENELSTNALRERRERDESLLRGWTNEYAAAARPTWLTQSSLQETREALSASLMRSSEELRELVRNTQLTKMVLDRAVTSTVATSENQEDAASEAFQKEQDELSLSVAKLRDRLTELDTEELVLMKACDTLVDSIKSTMPKIDDRVPNKIEDPATQRAHDALKEIFTTLVLQSKVDWSHDEQLRKLILGDDEDLVEDNNNSYDRS